MFAAMLALAGPAAAQEALPDAAISQSEVDSLPPEAVARRLFGDGGANLLPMWDGHARRGPSADVLRILTWRAHGRSSGFAGLCVAEQILVRFAAGGNRPPGPATRVRPERTWSTPVYYLTDDRIAFPPAALADAARPAEDSNCRAIDPRHVHVFLTRDAERLARTLGLLSQAVDAARRGTARAPLDCADTGGEGQAPLDSTQCMALIARIELDRVDAVRPCPGAERPCTIAEIGFDAPPGGIARVELVIDDQGDDRPPAGLVVHRLTLPAITSISGD